jgi:regulator of protease activity HflC (stomatin/prohibitin superfamily)
MYFAIGFVVVVAVLIAASVKVFREYERGRAS